MKRTGINKQQYQGIVQAASVRLSCSS